MTEVDTKTWEVLSRDPTYPCAKCRRVNHPEFCINKKCAVWRRWIMRDWLKMQYNAGVMTKEEFENRMERVYEQC